MKSWMFSGFDHKVRVVGFQSLYLVNFTESINQQLVKSERYLFRIHQSIQTSNFMVSWFDEFEVWMD
jgi:hypothetical protein